MANYFVEAAEEIREHEEADKHEMALQKQLDRDFKMRWNDEAPSDFEPSFYGPLYTEPDDEVDIDQHGYFYVKETHRKNKNGQLGAKLEYALYA